MVALCCAQLALIGVFLGSPSSRSLISCKIILYRVMIRLPSQISQALEKEMIVHQNSKHQDKTFLFR